MAKGLLFASFDFSTAHADEFHDWYDLEHIPERLRVPGFINAERWISDENPNVAVATYDLDSPAVLQSAPYQAIGYGNASVWTKRVTAMAKRILRFTGEQLVPGRPRRAQRRRRPAGRLDERRSGGGTRVQRVVQQPSTSRSLPRCPACCAPAATARTTPTASAGIWRCIT